MKKRKWKKAARAAEARAVEWEETAEALTTEVRRVAAENRRMARELDDKRRNWRPIPIPHPFETLDRPKCLHCDDPESAPRHYAG